MAEPEVRSFVSVPKADGSVERWELTDQWRLTRTDNLATSIATHAGLPNAHHPQTHEHPTHGDINFTGTISAGGEAGIDTSGEGEFEVAQIESIKVRNGLIVALTEK